MWKVLSVGVAALCVSLMLAVPAYAVEEEVASVASTSEENPNERICRRVHVTGSHIAQRVCMSRAEWTSMREDSVEELRESNDNSNANTSIVGGDH